MTTVAIYSTDYYFRPEGTAAVSDRFLVTDRTHPITIDDPRLSVDWWQAGLVNPTIDRFYGRVCSAWYGLHPHEVSDADVTVAMGINFAINDPDFGQRCLDELGDDDLLVMRHPWRDDILEEAEACATDWRWEPPQDPIGQARSYIEAGHPRHWGLFHGGMLIRRDTPAMRAFNEALWAEYRRWSSNTQVSLPHLLRTTGIRWHDWGMVPFEERWVSWGVLGVAA